MNMHQHYSALLSAVLISGSLIAALAHAVPSSSVPSLYRGTKSNGALTSHRCRSTWRAGTEN
jgi:hypothetical protein